MTRSSIKEEQQLLEEIYAAGQCRPAAKQSGVRRVGIFFVVQGKPFIDSTPVIEAESYEHFKIHGLDRASMNLPDNTHTSTDSHYRCPACLHKAGLEE